MNNDKQGTPTINLQHLAIILDGNGRWAHERGLEVSDGHKAGADNLVKFVKLLIKDYPYIKYLTVYAFSKENWGRSDLEVAFLMKLFEECLDKCLTEFHKENVRIQFLGNRAKIGATLRNKMQEIEEKTKNNDGFTFNICLSYSGREEIVDAIKKIHQDVLDKKLNINDLNEDLFKNYLYNPVAPYPDLVVRTGGDVRLSNFLLWEVAYSEFYSTKTYWPAFDKKALDDALENFRNRKRNFGKKHAFK